MSSRIVLAAVAKMIVGVLATLIDIVHALLLHWGEFLFASIARSRSRMETATTRSSSAELVRLATSPLSISSGQIQRAETHGRRFRGTSLKWLERLCCSFPLVEARTLAP